MRQNEVTPDHSAVTGVVQQMVQQTDLSNRKIDAWHVEQPNEQERIAHSISAYI